MLLKTLAALTLILLVSVAFAQSPPKSKTVRLHIDGFQKSRSGAV